MASAAGHVVDSPEQPVTNVQQLPGQVQMSSAQNTAPGLANTVPASPTARQAPGAHGAGTNHADAKLLAAIRHELESSRGHLSVQRRRELAARLMEHTVRELQGAGWGLGVLQASTPAASCDCADGKKPCV